MTDLPPPEAFRLPTKFKLWRAHQPAAIDQIINVGSRFTGVVAPTGCLSGDTIIQINRAKNSHQVSLAQAYYRQEKHFRRRKSNIASLTRSFDGKNIRLHPFEKIVRLGIEPVFQLILENGKSLKATSNHLILTTTGFVAIEKLQKGMLVVCDTLKTAPSGKRQSKKYYRRTQGLLYHPYANGIHSYTTKKRCLKPEGRLYTVWTHRLIVEANLNKLSLKEFILICRTNEARAKTLFFLDPKKWAIHHKDFDHSNNDLNNLEILIHEDHRLIHANYENFNQGIPELSAILSIKESGKEQVYDVLSCLPYENFVANGIVVHNSGKTLIAITAALLSGKRLLYLTSTKGLQQQLISDFSSIGLVDIRGRNNYDCRLSVNLTCDEGPCTVGLKCYSKNKCEYWLAVKRAHDAHLVVTNYSYWMAIGKTEVSLGDFDMIVADECHSVDDEVSKFLAVELKSDWALISDYPWPEDCKTIDDFRTWAMVFRDSMDREVTQEFEAIKTCGSCSSYRQRRFLQMRKNLDAVKRLSAAGDDWVLETSEDKGWFRCGPLWPKFYTEEVLWRGVDQIILMSATLNQKTLDLLGIEDDRRQTLTEYPHSFPVANRRIMHVPTVRVNHRASETDMQTWLRRIDQIIAGRRDRSGIIHTVSYARRNLLIEQSRHKEMMISHNRKDTVEKVNYYKRMANQGEAKILVSPSIATGWDFPYETCEYQIIGKIPYPDTTNKLVAARCKADQEYGAYVAMMELCQMAGRGVRAEDDRCECLLVDDSALWFMPKFKYLAPKWFMDAFGWVKSIPSTPEKLKRTGVIWTNYDDND